MVIHTNNFEEGCTGSSVQKVKERFELVKSLKAIISNKVFVCVTLATSCLYFVITGI